MSPEKGSEEEWAIEELRRQLDHQQAEYERYQQQAALFLRISLAIIGSLIAAISIFGREAVFGFIEYLSSFTFRDAASQIDLPIFLAEVMIFILYISFSVFSILFIIRLLSIPINTFNVAYPERLNTGLLTYQTRKLVENPPNNPGKYAFDELRRTLVENEEKVRKTNEQLKAVFTGAEESVIYGTLALCSLMGLATGGTVFDLVVVLLVSLAGTILAIEKVPWDKYRRFIGPYWETDTPIAIFLIWGFLEYSELYSHPLVTTFLLISLFFPAIAAYYSNIERLAYVVPRLILIFLLEFMGFFVHVQTRQKTPEDGVMGALAGMMLATIYLFITLIIVHQLLSIMNTINWKETGRQIRFVLRKYRDKFRKKTNDLKDRGL